MKTAREYKTYRGVIKVTSNKAKRTFTIRTVDNNRNTISIYRSYPQTKHDFEYYDGFASAGDWGNFLKSNDYYLIR